MTINKEGILLLYGNPLVGISQHEDGTLMCLIAFDNKIWRTGI